MINRQEKIYVAGHRGLVGSAIIRTLQQQGYTNLLTASHQELDLTDQAAVNKFFARERPGYVFLAAAKVGGIHANNTYRGEFIYKNIMIQSNVIEAARCYETKRLLFLGSSCIYPRDCPQPMKEEYLLTGSLESTNEPYAVAKIAGIKLCESYNMQYDTDFIAVMPTNLYGPHDNFDLENSHVLPALLRKFHEAKMQGHKKVTVWGTGTPKREFLYVDDMAAACIYVMNSEKCPNLINIGSGEEVTILDLAKLIAQCVGFTGEIIFDSSKPDGTPRKLVDSSKLHQMGFKSATSLRDGINLTYEWYKKLEGIYSPKSSTVIDQVDS